MNIVTRCAEKKAATAVLVIYRFYLDFCLGSSAAEGN